MVDVGRSITREFYIAAVMHSLVLGSQQPRFMTQLAVERGWPIQET
jgi:hypothetical protein